MSLSYQGSLGHTHKHNTGQCVTASGETANKCCGVQRSENTSFSFQQVIKGFVEYTSIQ